MLTKLVTAFFIDWTANVKWRDNQVALKVVIQIAINTK